MTTIRLCAICAAHAAAIEYYAADRAVAATTATIPHPYPAGGREPFVKQEMADLQAVTSRTFCILVDHLEAGVIGLVDIDHARGSAELGFWVARPYWGRGIATRAAQQILGYAGEHLGLQVLWSACLADNHGSKRVHEKAAFVLRGAFVNEGAYGPRHEGRRMLRFHHPFARSGGDLTDPRAIVLDPALA
jgi:ribosomal-protein-alanine N-acetyltransferase